MYGKGFVIWSVALALVVLPAGATGRLPPQWFDKERGVVSMATLLERVTPAVVNVMTRSRPASGGNPLFRDPFFRRYFNLPEPGGRSVLSAGSGVIIDAAKGHVVTNHHVIRNAAAIEVRLKDGRRFKAKVIGSDPQTDVALLKIPANGLTALDLSRAERVKVGDLVFAVGNPFGIGQTVTAGIVSGLGRRGLGAAGYENFIQTDAPINPGNSGGALINSRGELIGINTAIYAPAGGNVGIGFAVPSEMVRTVVRQLVRHGEVRRGRIGVLVQTLTPALSKALGVKAREGAVIARVLPRSPAAAAGLQPGDVIVGVGQTRIRDADDLRTVVGLSERGALLAISLWRKTEKLDLKVRVGAAAGAAAIDGSELDPRLAGARFATDRAAGRRDGRGLRIVAVAPGQRAWKAGLRQGDLVVAVNRRSVRNFADFRAAVHAVRGRALALTVLRGREQLFILLP